MFAFVFYRAIFFFRKLLEMYFSESRFKSIWILHFLFFLFFYKKKILFLPFTVLRFVFSLYMCVCAYIGLGDVLFKKMTFYNKHVCYDYQNCYSTSLHYSVRFVLLLLLLHLSWMLKKNEIKMEETFQWKEKNFLCILFFFFVLVFKCNIVLFPSLDCYALRLNDETLRNQFNMFFLYFKFHVL